MIHPTNNKINETIAFLDEVVIPALIPYCIGTPLRPKNILYGYMDPLGMSLLDLRCAAVAVNGEMSPEVASSLCEPHDDCLEIAIGTSVLEASITIDGVVVVMDPCLIGAAEP